MLSKHQRRAFFSPLPSVTKDHTDAEQKQKGASGVKEVNVREELESLNKQNKNTMAQKSTN